MTGIRVADGPYITFDCGGLPRLRINLFTALEYIEHCSFLT